MQSPTCPFCKVTSASVISLYKARNSASLNARSDNCTSSDPDFALPHQIETDVQRGKPFQGQVVDLEDVLPPLVRDGHGGLARDLRLADGGEAVIIAAVELSFDRQAERRLLRRIGDAKPDGHREPARGGRLEQAADQTGDRPVAGDSHGAAAAVFLRLSTLYGDAGPPEMAQPGTGSLAVAGRSNPGLSKHLHRRGRPQRRCAAPIGESSVASAAATPPGIDARG